MRILFLGTGPSFNYKRPGKSLRTNSSIIIKHLGKRILVDCSKDFEKQIKDSNVENVNALLQTHAHKDAIGGLLQLKKFIKDKNGQDAKVPLYAEREVWDKVGKQSKEFLDFHEIKPYESFELFGIKITPIRVKHSIQKGFPTLAFKFEQADDSFVYAEDVDSWDEDALKYFKNNDLLIWDGSFWDRVMIPGHRAILKDIPLLENWNNKKVYFTQLGIKVPNHEEAEKLVKEKAKEINAKTDFNIAYDGEQLDVFRIKALTSGDVPIPPAYSYDEPNEKLPGIYLVDKHAKLIWKRKKKEIVKSVKFEKYVGKQIYLCGDKVYGIITLNAPLTINLD